MKDRAGKGYAWQNGAANSKVQRGFLLAADILCPNPDRKLWIQNLQQKCHFFSLQMVIDTSPEFKKLFACVTEGNIIAIKCTFLYLSVPFYTI